MYIDHAWTHYSILPSTLVDIMVTSIMEYILTLLVFNTPLAIL